MSDSSRTPLLKNLLHLRKEAEQSEDGNRCLVSPSPELNEKIKAELAEAKANAAEGVLSNRLRSGRRTPIGMNDGLIYPGSMFPLGTPPHLVRSTAARRAPLTGEVRVVVVLAEFSDQAMGPNNQHFEELFFSQGVLPNGSVREYFDEVTNGTVDIQGQVVGPYTLPSTLATYAHGDSGIGAALPNARTMARDAAVAANPDVNFGIYDNDSDGFVDAFIVVHAGPGAEVTGSPNDIWSHKWVLSGGALNVDGTSIFAYLTVPEDARIGVCCHELGHLLFGFPDLYDTDDSSEGVGNWCLMGGGSWNGGGDIPAHPSAWCKVDQGWASVNAPTSNLIGESIPDVKASHSVYRLWKDGTAGSEYFLVENRQRTGFDAQLPGDGLLIWHIDETMPNNEDETHYKVGLEQADGNQDLENANNRGDSGDPYPGSSSNTTFDKTSTPNSLSYGSVDTCVAVKNIGLSGPVMQADLLVKCGKSLIKDFKDGSKDKFEKEWGKDKLEKEWHKEVFEKDFRKDKPEKELWEGKGVMGTDEGKWGDKLTDGGWEWDRPGGWGPGSDRRSDLDARVSALEARLGTAQPFIDSSLRPDLSRGALAAEKDLNLLEAETQQEAANAKRQFDTKPKETL